MKKLSVKIKSIVFVIVLSISFFYQSYLKSETIYCMGFDVGIAGYVALTMIFVELGIIANNPNQEEFVSDNIDSFEWWLNTIITPEQWEEYASQYDVAWNDIKDRKNELVQELKDTFNSARVSVIDFSDELSTTLCVWARCIRDNLGFTDNFDVAVEYCGASDMNAILHGGELTIEDLAIVCRVPFYARQDFLDLGLSGVLANLDTTYGYSIFESHQEYVDSYSFFDHVISYYQSGYPKRSECELIYNVGAELYPSQSSSLLKRSVVDLSKVTTAQGYGVQILKKGYFSDTDAYLVKQMPRNAYNTVTVPQLRWSSKTGTLDVEDYTSAKVIEESALADVYPIATDIPDAISRPHDLTDVQEGAIENVAEGVYDGTLTFEEAIALINDMVIDNATDTDTPVPPEDNNNDNDNDGDVEINNGSNGDSFNDLNMTHSLKELFPFCIPFDMYMLFKALKAEPKVPVFELPFKIPGIVNFTIKVDFSKFEILSKVLRGGLTLLFILALMLVTNKVIKW